MATNKSLSHHRNYQIAPSIIYSKIHSKSSESLLNNNQKIDLQQKEKQFNKIIKMKKSQTELTNFETTTTKPIEITCNATSILRRRFSLFRIKRSQPSNENVNVQALQQIIDKLRYDLHIKTTELEIIKKHTENKCNSIIQPSNESIEQAFQLQTILNTRLEEMLTENDLLKKSIQELESFAQQQKSKKNHSGFFFCYQ